MNTSSKSIVKRLARPLTITGSAALASSAQGALVQIDFIGNSITANGNSLFADIDFDGTNDLTFANANFLNQLSTFSSIFVTSQLGQVSINTAGLNIASAVLTSGYITTSILSIGGQPGGSDFIQAEFNSSALGVHQGFLEVRAEINGSDTGITIVRFIYDDASPTLDINNPNLDLNILYTSIGETSATGTTIVPEPSSLGLLALGAGGLALRRRRKAA